MEQFLSLLLKDLTCLDASLRFHGASNLVTAHRLSNQGVIQGPDNLGDLILQRPGLSRGFLSGLDVTGVHLLLVARLGVSETAPDFIQVLLRLLLTGPPGS